MGLASTLANAKPMKFVPSHRETHGPPIIEPERFPGALRRSNNVGDKYAPGTKALHDLNVVRAMKPKPRARDFEGEEMEAFNRSLIQQGGGRVPGLTMTQRVREENRPAEQQAEAFMQRQLDQTYPQQQQGGRSMHRSGRISKDSASRFDGRR